MGNDCFVRLLGFEQLYYLRVNLHEELKLNWL